MKFIYLLISATADRAITHTYGNYSNSCKCVFQKKEIFPFLQTLVNEVILDRQTEYITVILQSYRAV